MRLLALLLLTASACVQVERPLEAEEPFRCNELPSEHFPLAHYLIDSFPPPKSFNILLDFPMEVNRDSRHEVEFAIANRSGEAVRHRGYAPGSVLADLQHLVAGAWEFDWSGSMHCAMGLGTEILQPGESASLNVLRNSAFDARGVATLVGCSTGLEYRITTPVVPRHVCSSSCP